MQFNLRPTRKRLRIWRQRVRSWLGNDPNKYLWDCRGVIHVGANVGHEAHEYSDHDLRVLWIEPIPEVYNILLKRIAEFPKQKAIQALVTDVTGKEYEFKIANNGGGSSSILDMGQTRDIWPQVSFEKAIFLRSYTLANLLERNHINIDPYDCLVMDTQGSELLVLKGADALLHRFKFIKTEAADFEAYIGCARVKDISEFLAKHKFKEISRHQMASHPDGGAYLELLFKRTA